jgi:hypothetical protein
MKWLKRLNIVESGLLGIYISMIPACFVMVKVSESEVAIGELGYMFMMWPMLSAIPMTLMFLNYLANQGKKK